MNSTSSPIACDCDPVILQDTLCALPAEDPQILVYIPARGGSKGLPGKNIALLGNQPLIRYAIAPALRLEGRVRVMVDTDSSDIADVARRLGAEVPFLRESVLASDSASPGVAQSCFLQRLAEQADYRPAIIMTLFLTSPFRTTALLQAALSVLLEGRGSNILAARKMPFRPETLFIPTTGGARPLSQLILQGQGLMAYRPCAVLMARWWWSETPDFLLELSDPDTDTDIDTAADLALAQRLLEERGWTDNGWTNAPKENNPTLSQPILQAVVQHLQAADVGKEQFFSSNLKNSEHRASVLRHARTISRGLPVCGVLNLEKDHPVRLRYADELILEDILVPAQRSTPYGGWFSAPFPMQWPALAKDHTRFAVVPWLAGLYPLSPDAPSPSLEWIRVSTNETRVNWHTGPWPAPPAHANLDTAADGLFSILAEPRALVCGNTSMLYTNLPISMPADELRLECLYLRQTGPWQAFQGCWACPVMREENTTAPALLRVTRPAQAGKAFDLWRPPVIPDLWQEQDDATLMNCITNLPILGRQQLPTVWSLTGTLYLPEGWTRQDVQNIDQGCFVPLDMASTPVLYGTVEN